MNESVGLLLVPVRNSLIVIGLTFRTFSVAVVLSTTRLDWAVQRALAVRSPPNGSGPEVSVNGALTLAPAATEAKVFDGFRVPSTTEVHRPGTEMPSFTLAAVAPVVLV